MKTSLFSVRVAMEMPQASGDTVRRSPQASGDTVRRSPQASGDTVR